VYISNLACVDCGKKLLPGLNYNCPDCGGILTVEYHYERIDKDKLRRDLGKPNESIWQYKALLPIEDEKNVVSLREGGTPLLELENLRERYCFQSAKVKDETRNPTGSFKDRPTCVAISKAIELGVETVTVASSGNAAASVAGYSAKAGIKSFVFVPESTPLGKVCQASAYGGQIIKVKGDYSNSFRLALEASKKYNWANLTSTFLNPYTVEGDKTVAYELYYQLNGEVPDYIIVPIGAGPLLYGILKGYKELKALGFTNKIPAMIGIQAERCSPVVQAYESKSQIVKSSEIGSTIASGIADPLIGYEQDGTITLRAIYESKGIAVGVNEEEIVDAAYELGKKEGLFAEPTGATCWAGYKKLLLEKRIAKDGLAVLMLTGHGLKQPLAGSVQDEEIPVVVPRLSALEEQLHLG
jgi:threonine synthase